MEPKPITLLEAAHLKKCAAEDNIKVAIKIINKFPVVYVGKYPYVSFRAALQAVHQLQSQIAPSTEVRP